ncbi:MAG: glucose dehydrogenase [Nitrospirales bacterium]|nr:glucose dehydrogenase [Nitrospirales bacterium]
MYQRHSPVLTRWPCWLLTGCLACLWTFSPLPAQSAPQLALDPVIVKGLTNPLFLTHAGDHSGRLFIVEQGGRIRIVDNGHLRQTPFLDISTKLSSGSEQGLLGLAFHPAYQQNGRYFINYTRAKDGATVIAEYHVSSNPHRSGPYEHRLLIIPQPYRNHNGGMLAFGPDGLLYVGMGDGGAGGDPENRGQAPHALLGKILRIPVDPQAPGRIPNENGVTEQEGHPEIFALGFRNPWRFSFDALNGQLWVGDVGQNRWEEIDVVRFGENHGWWIMEGRHCFRPTTDCATQGLTDPIAEYHHEGSRCAITGGYVYRGVHMPSLYGTYVFGDYCSGEIMGLVNGKVEVLLPTAARIASFGEDEFGELYLVDHQGSIARITHKASTPHPR